MSGEWQHYREHGKQWANVSPLFAGDYCETLRHRDKVHRAWRRARRGIWCRCRRWMLRLVRATPQRSIGPFARPMRGRLTIVDQDGHGRPPANGLASPGLGSFDLSKKSAAQLAAELAAQMTSWRKARKSDSRGRAAAPAQAAARPSIMLATTRERFPPPTDWGIATATHIDRARRVAAQAGTLTVDGAALRVVRRNGSYNEPFESLLAEGPNQDAVGMGPQDAPDPPPPVPMPTIEEPDRADTMPVRAPGTRAPGFLREAIRGAAARAGRMTTTAQQVIAAGWRALIPALRTGFERARRRTQEIGPAAQRAARAAWPAAKSAGAQLRASAPAFRAMARHAVRDRLAIAGVAAILVAVAAWFIAPHHGGAPSREAARAQPEAAHAQKVALQPAIEPHAIVAAFEPTNRPTAAAIDRPQALAAAELRPHDPVALRLSQEPVLAFIPTLTPKLKPAYRNAQH